MIPCPCRWRVHLRYSTGLSDIFPISYSLPAQPREARLSGIFEFSRNGCKCSWGWRICYQGSSVDTLGCMSRATQHFVVSFENYRPALVWKLTYCMVYAVGMMCGDCCYLYSELYTVLSLMYECLVYLFSCSLRFIQFTFSSWLTVRCSGHVNLQRRAYGYPHVHDAILSMTCIRELGSCLCFMC